MVQLNSSVMGDIEIHNKEKDMLPKCKEERLVRLENKMEEYRTEKTMCVSIVRPWQQDLEECTDQLFCTPLWAMALPTTLQQGPTWSFGWETKIHSLAYYRKRTCETKDKQLGNVRWTSQLRERQWRKQAIILFSLICCYATFKKQAIPS